MPITAPDTTRRHFWREQIDAWQASDQSQRAFCEANDLSYPRFGYWLRKFRKQAASVPERSSGFVPVVAQPSNAGLSLRLPSGLELRGIREQNLSLVEQLLTRLS